jgi:hypothetical protein
VINAYVRPLVQRCLLNLESRLATLKLEVESCASATYVWKAQPPVLNVLGRLTRSSAVKTIIKTVLAAYGTQSDSLVPSTPCGWETEVDNTSIPCNR